MRVLVIGDATGNHYVEALRASGYSVVEESPSTSIRGIEIESIIYDECRVEEASITKNKRDWEDPSWMKKRRRR